MPGPDDGGLATSVADSTRFLYTGDSPIQTGVTDALDRWRAGVARGLVKVRGGEPLANATVRVLPRGSETASKYGQTVTGENGSYDLAIEGGEAVTLEFSRAGYLTAHRQVTLGWQTYQRVDDVTLVQLAPPTPISFPVEAGGALATGAWAQDADGERRAAVFFEEGTGTTTDLGGPTGNLSITEFTVGEDGPSAMPAELPATSAYTYAAEFSFAEAGGEGVEFTGGQAIVYVSNFLGFPVGAAVPSGWYDRTTARWIPQGNGQVIGVVGEGAGPAADEAQVDLDGDGQGETAEVLDAAGIPASERRKLSQLDDASHPWPHELWRVPVTHFSAYDFNWGYRPPDGWTEPPTISPTTDDPVECATCQEGSILVVENQALGESFPLTGTPFTLEYRSDRVAGRTAGRRVRVPLIPGSVPSGLIRVHVEIEAAGQLVATQDYTDAQLVTGLTYEQTTPWDGNDPYGRAMRGRLPFRIRVAYDYPAVYTDPVVQQAFMQSGGTTGSVAAREGFRFWRTWWIYGESWDQRGLGLGGLSLSAQHLYDPVGGVLLKGDGSRRLVSTQPTAASRFVGNLVDENDPYPAVCSEVSPGSRMGEVEAVAAAPDGSFFFTRLCGGSNHVTHAQVDRATGEVSLLPMASVPAAGTRLTGLAAAPDGRVYVADPGNNQVYRLTPAGPSLPWTLEVFAGDGATGPRDDTAVPREAAHLDAPHAVAVGADGLVYVTDTGHHRVVVIGTDDRLRPFAGTGTWARDRDERCPDGTNGTFVIQDALGPDSPAVAVFDAPSELAVEPDGDVLVAQGGATPCVRRVRRDGKVERVAGNGVAPPAGGFTDSGDTGLALAAQLGPAQGLAVEGDGTIYYLSGPDYADGDPDTLHGIRAISPTGIIRRVAGAVSLGGGLPHDGVAALGNTLDTPHDLALAPSGDLLVTDLRKSRVIRISGAFPRYPDGNIRLPSADGSEVYEFTAAGRHERTLDGLTGQELLRFGYRGDRLDSVTMKHRSGADETRVEIGARNPVKLTAPHGRVTSLALDDDGYIASLVNPAGETFAFDYSPTPGYPPAGGLLTTLTDPLLHASRFEYDSGGKGLLTKDTNASGGYKTLTRGADGSRQVTVTTRMGAEQSPDGRSWTYDVTGTPEAGLVQTAQSPAGLITTTTWSPDGVISRATPDGLTAIAARKGDPRFGMSAPLHTLELRRGGVPGATFSQESEFTGLGADPFAFESVVARLRVTPTEPAEPVRTHEATYDNATSTLVETSAQGRTRTTVFNAVGQPLTVSVPGAAVVEYGYDAEGRLQTHTLRQGDSTRVTSAGYSPTTGFLADMTDPEERKVLLDTDAVGRVTFLREPGFTPERVTGLGWDDGGNLTSLTPPGRPEHGFLYTPTDQLDSYTAPGPTVTSYEYNLDQQLEKITPPDGAAVDPQYDGRTGRLSTLTSGRTVTPAYDPGTGQLASLTVGGGGVALSYGYDGPLLTSTAWAGPVAGTVSRSYDSLFRVATHTAGGETLGLTYDLDDLPTGVVRLPATSLLSLARDPANGRVTGTDSTAVATTQSYTAWGEPDETLATGPAGTLFRENLDYHPDGRIQQKTEELEGVSTTTSYLYDAAGRLRLVTVVGGSATEYIYDLNGNRTDVKIDGVSQRTAARCGGANPPVVIDAQDRMTRDCTREYGYRQSGHLTSRTDAASGTTDYTYDSLGNLTNVTLPGGAKIEYVIDGQNRRVGRKERPDGGAAWALKKSWLYDDQLRVVVEDDAETGTTSRFVYVGAAHSPDLMIRGAATYRILKDHLGSPRVVVNTETGVVEQRMTFDAWGVPAEDWSGGGFVEIPFGFAGGLWERETGLVRFGARDYDAEIGRWISKDPIRFRGGDASLYAYVRNDPVNRIDPRGLFTEVIIFDPVGVGKSAFGHVAVNINGNYYNYDGSASVWPDGWMRYAADLRSARGIVLGLTEAQEAFLEGRLANTPSGGYRLLWNNCGDPVESALEDLGYELGVNVRPPSLEAALIDSGLGTEYRYYAKNASN